MAAVNIFLFILILSGFSTVVELVRAQQRNSNISLGSSLSPTTNTTSWLSSSGRFAFGFYPEGNGFNIGIWFAGIPQKTVVWTANQADPQVPSNAILILTVNGLGTEQSQNIYTDQAEPVSSASMLDTGNFVLYNSKLEIIWQSFDFPTNTILQGQRLVAGGELFSSISETDHSKGRFKLVMQTDGNLVQYPAESPDEMLTAYYSTGTQSAGNNVTLNLDDDGELYLLNSTGFKIRTVMNLKSRGSRLPTNRSIFYRMTIDVDGMFRLYSHTLYHNGNWSIVEESSTNKCAPMGLCGVNSYCILTDQEVDCRCFPGFRITDQGQRTLGCMREVSLQQCGNKQKQFGYNMSTFENIEWQDNFYSVIPLPTKEACRDACLGDCNCEAALFRDQRCRKQRLPLRYGRKTTVDGLLTAFIKDNTNNEVTGALKPNDNNFNNKKSGVLMIVILSVGSTMLVFGLIISSIIWRRRRKGGNNKERQNEDIDLPLLDLITIENATNNFCHTNKIGEGGFGPVYKGKLEEGQEIAVKRLSKDSGQGLTEFKNEVILIAKLQHRNLVKLLGCCIQGEEKMLVYEYMPNESLNYFIFDEKRSKLLDWEKRLDIIMGIARGLLYLHQDSRLRIIHRDLKASNILLDINLNPKISDFGLATLFEGDQTEAKTKRVVGTFGYMSPEYAIDGHFSLKSDVYSFGVLVLEIVSGKRNRGFYHDDHHHNLLGHAWILWKEGKALELMDKYLGDSYDTSSEILLIRCIQVGLLCVQQLQEDRPSMSSVVSMLGSENHVLLPEPKQPGFFTERSADGTSKYSREESCTENQVTISLLEAR